MEEAEKSRREDGAAEVDGRAGRVPGRAGTCGDGGVERRDAGYGGDGHRRRQELDIHAAGVLWGRGHEHHRGAVDRVAAEHDGAVQRFASNAPSGTAEDRRIQRGSCS